MAAAAALKDKAREKLAECVLWLAGVVVIRCLWAVVLVAAAYAPMGLWVAGVVSAKAAFALSFVCVAVVVVTTAGTALELLFDVAKDYAEGWLDGALAATEGELRARAIVAVEAAETAKADAATVSDLRKRIAEPVTKTPRPPMLIRWRARKRSA